jgi:hypothetical protein
LWPLLRGECWVEAGSGECPRNKSLTLVLAAEMDTTEEGVPLIPTHGPRAREEAPLCYPRAVLRDILVNRAILGKFSAWQGLLSRFKSNTLHP